MRSLLVAVLAFISISSSVFAQAPDPLSFQGFVTTPGGAPINNGGIAMTFKLYEGATEIWSETHTSVAIAGGVFKVLLGSVIPLDSVRFNRPLSLGIKVGTDPEISPRTPLAATAYAKAMPGLYTVLAIDESSTAYNVIGGGAGHVIGAGVVGATIGGGGGTLRGVQKPDSVLGHFGTIGGGGLNTIGGGGFDKSFSEFATIAGGHRNTARGDNTTVGGGSSNMASAPGATVPGGQGNIASSAQSFAAGFKSEAKHSGTFVWSDISDVAAGMVSTGQNQFLVRAAGGFGIGTNAPGSPLTVNGRIESETGGFKFPDGTIQTSAAGSDSWSLSGNAGTTPGSDYIGTSDGAALEIRATGGVGINTDTPLSNSKLHVEHGSVGTNDWAVVVTNSLATNHQVGMRLSDTGFFEITNNADDSGPNFAQLNSTGNWTAVSDRRLKTDIEPASDLLQAAMELEPVRYHFKNQSDQGHKSLGMIAQQVQEVVPSLVTDGDPMTLNYSGMSVVAIGAIRELYELVQDQQAQLAGQQAEIERLSRIVEGGVNLSSSN
ncbi:tail fiber domain-containing protein [Bacteroidota bacterium]